LAASGPKEDTHRAIEAGMTMTGHGADTPMERPGLPMFVQRHGSILREVIKASYESCVSTLGLGSGEHE
jgi:hypothetical protein